MLAMILMKDSGRPNLVSAVVRACGCILSNAFSQSRKRAYNELPVRSDASRSLLTMWIGCEVDLFCLKPNCVTLSLWSMAASSLLWRSLAKSLYAVERREMGSHEA